MTEYLSKADVQAFKGKIVPFESEELGGALPLRPVGWKDLMRVQEIKDNVERALEFIRIGIVDPATGKPMFSEEEFLEVANCWETQTVKDLADKLKELSGASKDVEGNSGDPTKGGSPTS